MASSLDELASNLPNENYIYTEEGRKEDELQLLKRKGVYPYAYFNSLKKFDKTELP